MINQVETYQTRYADQIKRLNLSEEVLKKVLFAIESLAGKVLRKGSIEKALNKVLCNEGYTIYVNVENYNNELKTLNIDIWGNGMAYDDNRIHYRITSLDPKNWIESVIAQIKLYSKQNTIDRMAKEIVQFESISEIVNVIKLLEEKLTQSILDIDPKVFTSYWLSTEIKLFKDNGNF